MQLTDFKEKLTRFYLKWIISNEDLNERSLYIAFVSKSVFLISNHESVPRNISSSERHSQEEPLSHSAISEFWSEIYSCILKIINWELSFNTDIN